MSENGSELIRESCKRCYVAVRMWMGKIEDRNRTDGPERILTHKMRTVVQWLGDVLRVYYYIVLYEWLFFLFSTSRVIYNFIRRKKKNVLRRYWLGNNFFHRIKTNVFSRFFFFFLLLHGINNVVSGSPPRSMRFLRKCDLKKKKKQSRECQRMRGTNSSFINRAADCRRMNKIFRQRKTK